MPKLTDTQLIVLSSAAAREDGAASPPARTPKAAAAKVGASLVARKLMREVRSKPGMPIWREDEEGRGVSLVILRAGRDAIGVEDEGDDPAPTASAAEGAAVETVRRAKRTMRPAAVKRVETDHRSTAKAGDASIEREIKAKSVDAKPTISEVEETEAAKAVGAIRRASSRVPRAGSKQALVVEMLSKSQGATLDALVQATGWLPHTARAALTGLRKRGYDVQLERGDRERSSVYRIAAAPVLAKAS